MSDAIFDCADGEPIECYQHDLIRARKTHKCFECGHPIVPRERHWRTKGRCDGSCFEERLCVCCEAKKCAVAAKAPNGYWGGACVMPGMLHQAIADGLEEGWLTEADLSAAVSGGGDGEG